MDDIYRNLSLESFPNLSKPALKRLELEVERENLSPVRQALDLIRNYRKKGKRILFISGYVFAFRFPEISIAEIWFLGRGGSYICIRRDRLNKAFWEFIPVYSKRREDIEMFMDTCGDNTYSRLLCTLSLCLRSRRILSSLYLFRESVAE